MSTDGRYCVFHIMSGRTRRWGQYLTYADTLDDAIATAKNFSNDNGYRCWIADIDRPSHRVAEPPQ